MDAGARLAAGGTYEDLFYRPTVLADVPRDSPAYTEEIFGPVAPVVRFDSRRRCDRLANDSPYGLSLGILTRDVMRGLEIAEQIPSGLVHINDQTINDEATIPFGGVGDSGTGTRQGGPQANLEAFTDTQWVTVRGTPAAVPDVAPATCGPGHTGPPVCPVRESPQMASARVLGVRSRRRQRSRR